MKLVGDEGTTALDVLRHRCDRCGEYAQHSAVSAGYTKPEARRLEDERLKNGMIRYVLRPRRCKECGDRTVADMNTVELKETDFRQILSLIPESPRQT